ncbi:MAG: hypothetical protein ACKO0Z_08005, partial [Betaproteobacteria bacterium]
LSIQFVPGASPSFPVGDLYKYRVIQPNRVNNLRKPGFDQWAWNGSSATLEIDFGAVGPVDAMMLTYHTLPQSATVTIELGTSPGVFGAPIALTWRREVMAKLLSAPISARYVRVTISGALGGRIGWLWLGSMLYAECCHGQTTLSRDYAVERAGLLNGSAQSYGGVMSGEVTWETAMLTETDRVNFVAMLDHVKLNHDEPLVFFPHVLHEDEGFLVRVEPDEIEFPDWNLYHPNDKSNRNLSVTIPFNGIIL